MVWIKLFEILEFLEQKIVALTDIDCTIAMSALLFNSHAIGRGLQLRPWSIHLLLLFSCDTCFSSFNCTQHSALAEKREWNLSSPLLPERISWLLWWLWVAFSMWWSSAENTLKKPWFLLSAIILTLQELGQVRFVLQQYQKYFRLEEASWA